MQARERINNSRGGGRGGPGRGYQQRNASALQVGHDGSVISGLTDDQRSNANTNNTDNRGQGGASERGSQNGRGFGRGAYQQGRGRGGRDGRW